MQPEDVGEGKHPCTGDNGNISWRHMESGNIGWEREAVLREGPHGPGLLPCMMKALNLSMFDISFQSILLFFSDAKTEM